MPEPHTQPIVTPSDTPTTASPATTLTDRARRSAAGIVQPIARLCVRLRIDPDAITVAGLCFVFVACGFILADRLLLAGMILLLSLPLDALDGAVARQMQRRGHFGAVLDSTLDRYADGFIFGAFSIYATLPAFISRGTLESTTMQTAALLALVGSFLVSYIRARGEGVGMTVRAGLFSRFERTIGILLALFLSGIPWVMEATLVILAVGTNITALQRLFILYRNLNRQD